MQIRQTHLLLASGLFLCAMGFSLVIQGGRLRQQGQVAATAASPPTVMVVSDSEPLPPFRLQRLGGTVVNEDLRGRWTLMLFGYLNCPQVCPTELALLRDARKAIEREGGVPPQVVFVSVDPNRDGVDLVARYVASFNAAFIGATAPDEALSKLTGHLGVFVHRDDQRGNRNYSVDHSAAIYLIDPKGRLKAVFEPPQRLDEMARNLGNLTSG